MTIENLTQEEGVPKEETETETRGRILEARRHFGSYITIQIELMKRRYGSKEEINKNADHWIDQYAAEYSEAFEEVVKEDLKFIEHLESDKELMIEKIGRRMETLHAVEERLLEDVGKLRQEKFRTLTQWRDKYGKKLLKLLHKNPILIKRYEASEDQNPEERETVIREIEEKLYSAEFDEESEDGAAK